MTVTSPHAAGSPDCTPEQAATPTVIAAIPRLALSVTEAAQALGVSVDFLADHIAPELRWCRRGRKKLVAVSELERWLVENSARVFEGVR